MGKRVLRERYCVGGEIVASQDVATRAVSASPTLHSFVAGVVLIALRA